MTTMPILDRICSDGKRYENILLLNINHDLKDTYLFSSQLQKKFGKVVQIGVSYSSSSASDREPFRDGIYYYAVNNPNKTFSLQRNEVPLRIRTQKMTDAVDMMITVAVSKDILSEIRKGMKMLIIEDGGYHSLTIDNLEEIYPELNGMIIGSVEQTTSGTRILSSRKHYYYPSISIARSEIKTCLEPVFIGQRIVEELSSFLAHTNHFLDFSEVLLIGYGIFGRAVAKKLEGYRPRITVCDKDAIVRDAAEKEGYPVVPVITAETFRPHQIIIAMTGNKSFGISELEQYMLSDADQILLSSGSSKDIEYRDILDMIESPEDSAYAFTLEEEGPFYEKYKVNGKGREKRFYLIAHGKPVNFSRDGAISLTNKMIDLLFAEMTLCACALLEAETIENGLTMLADQNAPVQIDEWGLIREWFLVNCPSIDPDEIHQCLLNHPCKDYLRRITYQKQSMDLLI